MISPLPSLVIFRTPLFRSLSIWT